MGSERDMSHATGDRHPGAYPAYPGAAESSHPARPPLTKRMRPIHWIALDCFVAGFLALIDAATAAHGYTAGPAKLPLLLLFLLAVFVPIGLRRRAPVTAFGALVILGVLVSGMKPAVPGVIFLGAAFVLYTVTVESRKRTGAAALGLVLLVLIFLIAAGVGKQRDSPAAEFVPIALANVLAWMTGYSVRQRRLYVVTLQQQAANSAVAEERLRIARELHDVVAHSMSVIAVQAGYGQYVIDASPDGAKDALGAIQATSRDALEEMRRMLGVLRQQDVTPPAARVDPSGEGQAIAAGGAPVRPVPLAPAPGLAGLDRLIERTRGAAVRVTLEVSGHPRPAPAGVDLSAYRIIQEALTNVVRHAGTGASCLVSVGYTDADLVIRVTDDGGLPVSLPSVSVATAGTGHGIIGMRERVHLCGGTFGAGRLPNRGFQVTATLPLPALSFNTPAGPRAEAGLGAAGGPASSAFMDSAARSRAAATAAPPSADQIAARFRAVANASEPAGAQAAPAVSGAARRDGGGRR